jgi:hypothetical protein
MCFILHFQGRQKINLPFYLLKSLTKMVVHVQTHSINIEHNIFHHGLIKLLIVEELKKIHQTWNQFPFWNGFQEDSGTVENLDFLSS